MTFFDIYSYDTFNAPIMPLFKNEEKEIKWPKWLTLPVHYDKTSYWRKVMPFRTGDGLDYYVLQNNDRMFLLDCSHKLIVPQVTLALANKTKVLAANCIMCGGTGEIKFI